MSSARQELLRLLATKSFKLGEFKLSSGGTSDYYVDCRTTTLDARGAQLTGQVFLDPRRMALPSVFLIAWGLFALFRRGPRWEHPQWEKWIRGLSLMVLGTVMLVMSRVPFLWVGRLFAVAGLILVLRGVAGSLLVLRLR